MEVNIPVGTIVQWRPFADLKQEPYAAIVTRSTPHGCLDLATIPANTRDFIPRRGVWNIDDPHLKERPQLAKETGGWSFLHSQDPQPLLADTPKVQAQVPKEKTDEKEDVDPVKHKEEIIMKWAAKGKPASEIARYVSMKTSEVEKIILDNSVES